MIDRESARRLILLGGTGPAADSGPVDAGPRRRPGRVIPVDPSAWVAPPRATDQRLVALPPACRVRGPLMEFGIAVDRIDRTDRRWRLTTTAGPVASASCPWPTLSIANRFPDPLGNPPTGTAATGAEVVDMVARDHLFGLGRGLVGTRLSAGVRLTPGAQLWTNGRRPAAAAARFGVILHPIG